MLRNLNWSPSPKDERDLKFNEYFKVLPKIKLPSTIDLSTKIPEVWDQGEIGACVFFSTGMTILHRSRLQDREINPSKLFFYYITREYEGTLNEDSGAYVRDAFKMLNKTGVCKEQTWPYMPSKLFMKPSSDAYIEAANTKAVKYYSLLKDLNELKTCLTLERPFVFGFRVYESFMNDPWPNTMPLPKKREKSLGGHAVVCVGFDDKRQAFRIKNSWGKDWKDKGYFWMPYSFITSGECSDFWTLELLSEIKEQPQQDDFVSNLRKVFKTKKEFSTLSENFIVRIGVILGLDVDMIYTKKKNIDTVSSFLDLV